MVLAGLVAADDQDHRQVLGLRGLGDVVVPASTARGTAATLGPGSRVRLPCS